MNFNETAHRVWKSLYDSEMELTESNIRTVLKSGYTAVALALVSGEEVVLPGLGNLVVEQRAEKAGRNPRTGEAITIPAQRVVKFRPFKALKDAINTAEAAAK